ncbi:ParB/RepB/Spo0J family partition protein [Mesorhizobium sp. M7A.F.Ca.CA.001.07.2.1]|uniref:ParB/RepB/Spo0J family partition protein n=4 Tax=Phyllobacteriaceae TaxID=69277 RepID=UPI000FCBCFFD|nr:MULTISPECIES: ParB/RepB/Spo0J family partition protein [Mesorhizobium]MCF6126575.1 ParB/RepB/Spo0J family partition protein [Mesorhizobium ciceri]MCQ8817741.1 ParB/RepB/Spo0J family partition protein [Mesorhizobium sp. SEMIA396]RUX80994.1 ParB/RepB/Spo0J family partition protein [Mesorhizobium sp. M7A.F.Ca.CA.004.08.2.1]RUX88416.1 ParB/RepB/Spo0J family partition protein [Mesorhizobium sp. M7A.F.Ca.CA.004.08.1.1]RUY00273.1 ParB/RepB/Spo0J family partition protein [Mesorhizobium sp. M7A.F.Ca
MATAVQKITLSSSRDIPFNKLVLAQSNVRRIKAGVSIEDLAASIARRGLIQSLHVRPLLDAGGDETGIFEVPAGGRRYRALEMLVSQKRLARTAPVPCVMGNNAVLAEEVSLAENIDRVPLHPLDAYRAFKDMRDKGMSEEEIAAAFFISVTIVKQRLKLTAVSPALLDVYADAGMTIAQLEAFSVSDDHAKQEQVWEAINNSWSKEPYQIRRMLTENTVRASDKRSVFVGLDAYEAAGGQVLRDLFQSDDGGWLQDALLLDRLVAEKLQLTADEIANEGWKWIEVAVSFPYGAANGLRELHGTPVDLTDEEQATLGALRDEFDKLQAEYEEADELPDEIDQRFGELEAAICALEARPVHFDPVDIAKAGVFLSVDADGSLLVERGYVKPEDEASVAPDGESDFGAGGTDDGATSVQRAVITIGGQPAQPQDDEEDGIKPLPDRLIMELTAERTLALRDKLANDPAIAYLAVLHKFVRDVFSRYRSQGVAMEVSVRGTVFSAQSAELRDTPYAHAVEVRHAAWETRLPGGVDDLWDALAALTDDERAALFAHCASFGVNALYEKADRYGNGAISAHGVQERLTEADHLARVVGLDMVDAGWRPTVGNYLGRVTKARIIEAVREGEGESAAQLIDHLKKDDMAKEAERLLADSGWLPEPLRLIDLDAEGASNADEADKALPDFLAGDDEDSRGDEKSEQQLDAAE